MEYNHDEALRRLVVQYEAWLAEDDNDVVDLITACVNYQRNVLQGWSKGELIECIMDVQGTCVMKDESEFEQWASDWIDGSDLQTYFDAPDMLQKILKL